MNTKPFFASQMLQRFADLKTVGVPPAVKNTLVKMSNEVPGHVLAYILNLLMYPTSVRDPSWWSYGYVHPFLWGSIPANWLVQPRDIFVQNGVFDTELSSAHYEQAESILFSDFECGRWKVERQHLYAWMFTASILSACGCISGRMDKDLHNAVRDEKDDQALRLFLDVLMAAKEPTSGTEQERAAHAVIMAKVRSFGIVQYAGDLDSYNRLHDRLQEDQKFLDWAFAQERVVA